MTTALYRRYRPDTFQDVIGQEHVTAPLMAALRGDRVTHAYLFSGPRGCGKTTSARILARCLNCERFPTDTPCGQCPSCRDLATGGPGSLDVVEIDAASHNGVDDARDLRERAAFAPARDRYKIFILDEAHMVTAQGFNALLKLVEEPPAHVKFVFATTEPEKVIGTIRSRTHHYPFRLVPPDVLEGYLGHLCSAEGVSVGAGVFPLVVRAGGGSVRDTLSVMDQLMGGATEGTVDYARAVALLGYTDVTLLDSCVDAIAAADGAGVFRVVDRVVTSGHDPRRFVEDLLTRLRDLLVIALAGEEAGPALGSLPPGELERMEVQSRTIGAAGLSRAADMTAQALGQMVGATSPRLQLELLMARLLVPAQPAPGAQAAGAPAGGAAGTRGAPARTGTGAGKDAGPAGTSGRARAAQIAQRSASATGPAASWRPEASPTRIDWDAAQGASEQRRATGPQAAPGAQAAQGAPPAAPAAPQGWQSPQEGRPLEATYQDRPGPRTRPPAPGGHPAASGLPASGGLPAAGGPADPAPRRGEHQGQRTAPAQGPTGPGAADAEMLRARWEEVLDSARRSRRATWALVKPNAQPGPLHEGVLTVLFTAPGLVNAFENGGHGPILAAAIHQALGLRVEVHAVLAGGDGPAGPSGPGGRSPGDGPGRFRGPGGSGPGGGGISPGGSGPRPEPGAAGEEADPFAHYEEQPPTAVASPAGLASQPVPTGPPAPPPASPAALQTASPAAPPAPHPEATSPAPPPEAASPTSSWEATPAPPAAAQAVSPALQAASPAPQEDPPTASQEDGWGPVAVPGQGPTTTGHDATDHIPSVHTDASETPSLSQPIKSPASVSPAPPPASAHVPSAAHAVTPAAPATSAHAASAATPPGSTAPAHGPRPGSWSPHTSPQRAAVAWDPGPAVEQAPPEPATQQEPHLATVHRLHPLPPLPAPDPAPGPVRRLAPVSWDGPGASPDLGAPQQADSGRPDEDAPASLPDGVPEPGRTEGPAPEAGTSPPSAHMSAAERAARAAARQSRPGRRGARSVVALEDDVPSEDDEDAEEAGAVGLDVVIRLLGATVIENVTVTQEGR